MPRNNRKENLQLYACLLRKYYIGEEDYMYITLSKIEKTEINTSWNYAVNTIKHDERIKNSLSITQGSFNLVTKRYDEFDNHDQIVKYLLSEFDPSKIKLNDENIERRLRYLLAIKTLKSLEKSITCDFLESQLEYKSKREQANLHEKLINEYSNLKKIEISKRRKIKRTGLSVSLFLLFIISFLGYFSFRQINEIDSITKEINVLRKENYRLNNLLQNEQYLSQIYNEKRFESLKQNGFTGNISFDGIFGYKSISGHLFKGEERGVWVYEKYNGEKEVYKWISTRVGAICRDGSRSYATGRGTCSHHGGVDYWLNEYQRVKVTN